MAHDHDEHDHEIPHLHGSQSGAGHGHSHAIGATRSKLAVVFGLTATVMVAEVIGAWWTGSLALLTDAAHALTDTVGLGMALIAASLAARPATKKRTWGFSRIEVLSALGQAALLLGVGIYAAIEGVQRLVSPPEISAPELLIFGGIGLAANIVGIVVLASGRDESFNMRAAFLEVINDALGSVGVIVAAIVMATTGFAQADAIAGLVIVALIVPRAIRLMIETIKVLMEYTPDGLDLDEVRRVLLQIDHVQEVHDLHASTVSTGQPRISGHIVVQDECFTDGHAPEILKTISECVAKKFRVPIEHSTFQLETETHSATEPMGAKHA